VVKAVNLKHALSQLDALWSPAIVGQVNDQHVKVARLKGEFTWHKHDDEDELFLVVQGRMRIQFEDGDTLLEEGDFCVVPRGVRHNPVADEECWIALIETVTTKHTGDVHVPGLTRTLHEQARAGDRIVGA
jgi:mannose-6-phosphate isomerase-like protein (cupin superfamily)